MRIMASTCTLLPSNIAGDAFEVDVESSDTIAVVKTRIRDATRIGVKQQRLIFDGSALDDDARTVSECGMDEGAMK